MKIYIAVLVIVMSCLGVQAQNNKRVTGPKAKNIKPRDRLSHIRKTTVVDSEKVTGPEAKNIKPSERLSGVEKIETPKREVLKGPKAKNRKHFRKNKNSTSHD